MKVVIIFMLMVIKISVQNATTNNITQRQQSNIPSKSSAPPLTIKFPYTPSRKSALEELAGGPLVPGPASKSLPPNDMSNVPEEFVSNFDDFAFIDASNNNPGRSISSSGKPIKKINLPTKTITQKAIDNIAKITHTQPECYKVKPMNISDISALMGDWYISTYRYGKVRAMRHTVQRVTCEDIRYTQSQTNKRRFLKDANVYFRKQWMTIRGSGRLITPGVILIYWKQLNQPDRDTQLTYNILCTNYKTWVIGYTCTLISKQPQLVLQTNSPRPTQATIDEANQCIQKNSFLIEKHLVNYQCAMDY